MYCIRAHECASVATIITHEFAGICNTALFPNAGRVDFSGAMRVGCPGEFARSGSSEASGHIVAALNFVSAIEPVRCTFRAVAGARGAPDWWKLTYM